MKKLLGILELVFGLVLGMLSLLGPTDYLPLALAVAIGFCACGILTLEQNKF